MKISTSVSPGDIHIYAMLDVSQFYVFLHLDMSAAAKEGNEHRRFVLTYEATGAIRAREPLLVSFPFNRPISFSIISGEPQATPEYSTISILLHVPHNNQTNETFSVWKNLFAQSANEFIQAEHIDVHACNAENVRFVKIEQCSRAWQDSQNCLKIKLAIPLERNGARDGEKIVHELNSDHLREMWILFGQHNFLAHGFAVRLAMHSRRDETD